MKVVILGGGPAGCAAAHQLALKGVNDVTIVEREALGGCCRTQFYEGIPYEFGPQVMYTDEDRLRQVFESFLTQNTPPTTMGNTTRRCPLTEPWMIRTTFPSPSRT